ncbi:MAG: hypothetical protein ACJ786_06880 [Catenulispora sp.]
MTRISVLGIASATALALTACGGSGSVKGNTSTTKGGPVPGSQSGGSSTSTPSPSPSFDPAAGPTIDAKDLPKTCSGLVTDADLQLALGNPLNGGDFFTAYQPDAGHKQTGRVKCQYGVVLDNSGKITSDQVDVQLATYADAASAQSRAAATVGTLAGGGAQYAQAPVGGHPATYVTEAGKDAVLVMYDGNRTFLITVQEALVKGEDAKAFALKIAAALYKHTTPTASQIPTGAASGGSASGSGSAPASSGSAPAGSGASSGASAPPANSAPSSPAKS